MKRLIVSLCTMLVAASLLGSSTYAWFSMNKSVTATGMKVEAQVDASLIITKDALPTTSTATTTVDFADSEATMLFASTHDASYATGLKYVTNPDAVDAVTGLHHSGESDLNFDSVANDGNKTFYKDYVVYIATSGKALSDQILTFELYNISPSAAVDSTNINGAISADFYVLSSTTSTKNGSEICSTANFIGTMNLAKLDPVVNNASTSKTSVVTTSAYSIPTVTIDTSSATISAVAVLARIYVDGALAQANGASGPSKTFINNADAINIAAYTLGFKISIADKPVEQSSSD